MQCLPGRNARKCGLRGLAELFWSWSCLMPFSASSYGSPGVESEIPLHFCKFFNLLEQVDVLAVFVRAAPRGQIVNKLVVHSSLL